MADDSQNRNLPTRPDDSDDDACSSDDVFDEIERIQKRGAQFSCLGIGCLPWLIAILVASILYLWRTRA